MVVGKHNGLTSSDRRLYDIWNGMIRRCTNPSCKDFSWYGARGIDVCEEWKTSFESFVLWSKTNGYESHLTLDRINSDGDYYPQNCRWITMSEQARNRRSCVVLFVLGRTLPAIDWAIEACVPWSTVYTWVRRHGVNYAERRLTLRLLANSWFEVAA